MGKYRENQKRAIKYPFHGVKDIKSIKCEWSSCAKKLRGIYTSVIKISHGHFIFIYIPLMLMIMNGKRNPFKWSRKREILSFVLLLSLLSLPQFPASAAISQSLNYQGKLADSSGNPLSGTYDFMFRFCADPACATMLYKEKWDANTQSVPVINGVYSVQIGSFTAIPPVVFNGPPVYLEVSVEGPITVPTAINDPCTSLRNFASEGANCVHGLYVPFLHHGISRDIPCSFNRDRVR